MSKINQIQSELRALDQAKFQRLCDLYLHKRGYEHINSLGLVIGADKVRKGTPDSLVPLPNGKYVFVESTTQQERVCEKFQRDLVKCFDEEKTGIPVEKIEEVVLCHNTTLSSSEENSLAELCQKNGCNLNVFGIGPLAYDLYQKYPGLAQDFLGVEIDTRQIVAPTEFVSSYNKSPLATPLDTAFHFRTHEVERVLQTLETDDVIVISGRAGVGKSRMALECCTQFSQIQPDFRVFCINNRGADLFNDLQVYLNPPGKYLILVDDANRVSGLHYILQFLHEQTLDRKVKIVLTVRDYAIDKVQEQVNRYSRSVEVIVSALSEKEIKELISDECNIHHPYALERISEIANGNARLAIMAARVAARENTLQSINDVSALYDEYFGPIWKELNKTEDADMLKVAGIVTFFRVVNRTNKDFINTISEAFKIAPGIFWERACQLHQLEIFDRYEDEIVKVSDQVLSTYLFYVAFFKEQCLSFSTLLGHFFPTYKYRLVDSINPVLAAFDQKKIGEQLLPHVNVAWAKFREENNEVALLELMHAFWFLKRTDVLCYIQDQIDALEEEPVDFASLDFSPSRNASEDPLLKLICHFRFAAEEEFKMALDLLFAYLAKRPSLVAEVLRLLNDHFCFRHDSYLWEFRFERCVVDLLWNRVNDGKHLLFSKTFLVVAEHFLHTHHHTRVAKEDHAMTIFNFSLPPTPQILEMRNVLWQRIFGLNNNREFQSDVLRLIKSHKGFEYHSCEKKIVEEDAAAVLPFFESSFDQQSYAHCAIVHNFLDSLDRKKVAYDEVIRNKFRNETFILAEILFDDWAERSELGWKQYQEQKSAQIKTFFADYTEEDYAQFFKQCKEIWDAQDNRTHDIYEFHGRILESLDNLASDKPQLFAAVMTAYLKQGDSLCFADYFPTCNLVAKLIEIEGAAPTFQLLSRPEFPLRQRWLSFFFMTLPAEAIAIEYVAELYLLYRNAELGELPQGLDFLQNYQAVDGNTLIEVVSILLERANHNLRFGLYLACLFNEYAEISKNLVILFAQHVGLLKQAYFLSLINDRHPDYKGIGFKAILDLDKSFAGEYVEWIYGVKSRHEQVALNHFDDERNYDFLWLQDDWMEILKTVVWKIYEIERERYSIGGTYAEVYFVRRADKQIGEEIQTRQKQFLIKQITQYSDNTKFMSLIFQVVVNFAYEQRLPFFRLFLECNGSFEAFTGLPLEPNSFSWTGSAVPYLQKKVEYFESLVELVNSVSFLKHKQYLEQSIQETRAWIEREKKHDFIEG